MQMTRAETCDWIQKKLKASERVCISRYADGEHLLMNGKVRAGEDPLVVGPLLKRSIIRSGQLVCINELKPHNTKDIWFRAHNYLKKAGHQDVYGGVNWNTYDYLRGSLILPRFFSKRTLIVGAHADALLNSLIEVNPEIESYPTASAKASHHYSTYLDELKDACKKFDNIVFICGPLSKVLVADLVDKCDANLVDMGAMANALLDGFDPHKKLTLEWTMSWTRDKPLMQLSESFLNNLKKAKHS